MKRSTIIWFDADDVRKDVEEVLQYIDLPHIDMARVHCYRTTGSTVRAYARTWAFPKIFQRALGIQAAYVIEVVSNYYDKLDEDRKKKVLIHELLHIPKNFSGALLPHKTGTRNMKSLENKLFREYKNSIKKKV
jgi:predicted metallopeptidase